MTPELPKTRKRARKKILIILHGHLIFRATTPLLIVELSQKTVMLLAVAYTSASLYSSLPRAFSFKAHNLFLKRWKIPKVFA